jgi:hypothetical protein
VFRLAIRGRRSAFTTAMLAVFAIGGALATSATGNGPSTAHHQPTTVPAKRIAAARRSARSPAGRVVLTFPQSTWPVVLPAGFLGLGVEYQTLRRYVGDDPHAIDPVFARLIRNLSPGQAPDLRIGGGTSDWTWWPVPGMAPPPTTFFTLTPHWVSVLRALDRTLHARLIMGINIKADSVKVAVTEAQQLLARMGKGSIEAFELGNEPDIFSSFGGHPTAPGAGRRTYNFETFLHAFTRIADAMPPVPIAGPAFTGAHWLKHFAAFLGHEPLVQIATVHRYPLFRCRVPNPAFPSVSHLLSVRATYGLAHGTIPWIHIAHAKHVPIRIDEMNATQCPGAAIVLRTFAESLWALRSLFELADVGADGVNIQTTAAATDDLFTPTHGGQGWQVAVQPEYYGLLMFAQTAPPGARVVRLSKSATAKVQAWATRAVDGTVRVVIVNLGNLRKTVALDTGIASGPGTLERLQGSSLTTTFGVRLGGQTFGSETSTGRLAGRRRTSIVKSRDGDYVVGMPALSAAMLTIG